MANAMVFARRTQGEKSFGGQAPLRRLAINLASLSMDRKGLGGARIQDGKPPHPSQ
jgi:hypothetical protein